MLARAWIAAWVEPSQFVVQDLPRGAWFLKEGSPFFRSRTNKGTGEICRRREGDPPVLVSDSKAKRLLGWKPHFPSVNEQISHAWR